MKPFLILFLFLAATAMCGEELPFQLPQDVRQVVLVSAEDWNESAASLRAYEKISDTWKEDESLSCSVRLGKNGMGWGIGLHPSNNLSGPIKREGDGRTPAGVFLLGGAYGYEKEISTKKGTEYHQVSEYDLWVEDSFSPLYNQHIRLNHPADTWWEKEQQMRMKDPAHKLKLFIQHNYATQCQPGAGSAIFFHIWRAGGSKPSTGCIVMPEERLRALVAWVDVSARPVLIALPRSAYQAFRSPWNLP